MHSNKMALLPFINHQPRISAGGCAGWRGLHCDTIPMRPLDGDNEDSDHLVRNDKKM